MNLCFITDGLSNMPFEQMLDCCVALGIETLEFGCGNWSAAPHLNIDALIESPSRREKFAYELLKRNLRIETLNCSGNQLAPNEDGRNHQRVVEKTFKLSELLGIKKVVMMSGLPGGSPEDKTPNWICTSWPPDNQKILDYQWNEVLIPYWKKNVQTAKDYGIERIALENHGNQMVYNPETLLRLRNSVGEEIGINLDPSHLFWMGADPIASLRILKGAIYHVHAKDSRLEPGVVNINGVLDTKKIDRFAERSWNYVALGYGHDLLWWKAFFSTLSMMGYNGAVSLEMEDMTMDALTGVKKSIQLLKEALPIDKNS